MSDRINVRLIELSKTVNIKGFRPGKVPVHVLKRQFGKAVYGEVLEKVLKEEITSKVIISLIAVIIGIYIVKKGSKIKVV